MSEIVEKVKQALFDAFCSDAGIDVESASLICGNKLFLYGEWDADAISRAAIAAYESEREDRHAEWRRARDEDIMNLGRDLGTALERIRELEEALRPFAEVAEHDIGSDEENCDRFKPISADSCRSHLLTVGDLRRARAVLEAKK